MLLCKPIKLSILIPTIITDADSHASVKSRAHFLARLLSILEPQRTPEVEILVLPDNGRRSIGDKRNELVQKSQGEYVCFVDDDDRVATDYVARILAEIPHKPDAIGFRLQQTTDGTFFGYGIYSIRYEKYGEHTDPDGTHVWERTPNHLNPIRREIVVKFPFAHKSWSEDTDYAKEIRPHLKTERFIDGEPMYFYDYMSTKAVVNHYSQNDEQGYIVRYFFNICGRFLDIGAYDGETLSNTRALALANWSGVCVEPAWSIVRKIQFLYQDTSVKVEPSAVTIEDGDDIDFWDACGDAVSSAVESQLAKWASKVPFTKTKVKRISVDSLFAKYGYDFDFISLGTELMNMEIFRALPWKKLTETGLLKMICVEHDRNIDEMKAIAARWGLTQELARNGENIILARPQ